MSGEIFIGSCTALNTLMSLVALQQRHLSTYEVRRKLKKQRRKAKKKEKRHAQQLADA